MKARWPRPTFLCSMIRSDLGRSSIKFRMRKAGLDRAKLMSRTKEFVISPILLIFFGTAPLFLDNLSDNFKILCRPSFDLYGCYAFYAFVTGILGGLSTFLLADLRRGILYITIAEVFTLVVSYLYFIFSVPFGVLAIGPLSFIEGTYFFTAVSTFLLITIISKFYENFYNSTNSQ